MLAAVAAILLVAALLISMSIYSDQVYQQQVGDIALNGESNLWKKIVSSQLDQMEFGTSALTRNRKALKALKAGDEAGLKESVESTFRRLSASKTLSKLRVIDKQSKIVFSAPGSTGGASKSLLVQQALKERKVFRGLEQDQDGEIVAVLAFPLYSRGKVSGVGLFARNLQAALDDFKLNNDSEAIILNAAGANAYSTNEELTTSISNSLAETETPGTAYISSNNLNYFTAHLPVMSADGQTLGRLVSLRDETARFTHEQKVQVLSYLAIFSVILAIMAGYYWYLNRAFRPLNEAIVVLGHIAEGDLRADINITSNDEIGQLLSAMLKMLQSLQGVVQQISSSTGQLSEAQVSMDDSSQQSKREIQQLQDDASQVATAMNQMTATVREVAHNAENTASMAREADQAAENGNKILAQGVSSINELAQEMEQAAVVVQKLDDNSEKIGGILDVIRGIADQTNLLALNAAIEAARAGEQGRGFAVVADEVRTLAQRTQVATEEIDEMISSVQKGAKDAVTVMSQGQGQLSASVNHISDAGEALEQITTSVKEISNRNTQIATAAEEQAAVTEEINRNIVNIHEVSEAASAGAVQVSLAAATVAERSGELRVRVSHFQL